MLRVVSVLLITLVFSFSAFSEGTAPKRYDVKSGIIEYKLDGARVGTETLYFDDWGRKEARVTKASTNLPGSQNSPENRLALIIDGKSINVDLNTKRGTITDNLDVIAMSGDNAPRSQMSAPINKNINIAGEDCSVWQASLVNSEVCLWNNIPLKTESGSGTTASTKTAFKIDLDGPLPKEAFDIPEGTQLSKIQLSNIFTMPDAG